MTDEAPHTEDTPTSTPNADTHEIPWQKRYEDLRPEFDRTKQELAAWEDEQTALAKLAEKFPHLFEDGEEDTDIPDDDDYVDPRVAELEQRLARLEPWQQDVESERAERRFQRDLKNELGDETVPERAVDWIKSRTTVLGNNPDALKKAVGEYREFTRELTGAHLDQVTKSKKTTSAPPTGKAGTQVPNLDDRQAREQYMRQRIREIEAQQ